MTMELILLLLHMLLGMDMPLTSSAVLELILELNMSYTFVGGVYYYFSWLH